MAEDIRIVGVDPSVPGWAREETLNKIVSELKKLNGSNTRENDELKDAVDELVRVTRRTNEDTSRTDNNTEIKEALNRLSSSLKQQKKSDNSLSAKQGGNKPPVLPPDNKKSKLDTDTIGAFITAVGTASKAVAKFTLSMASFAVGGSIYAALKQAASSQLTLSRDLYKSGWNFGTVLDDASGIIKSTNLDGISYAIKGLGINSSALSEVLKGNELAIQKYGIKSFVDLSSSLKRQGNSLGMSLKETADYVGEYLESQRLMGTFDKMRQVNMTALASKALKDTQAFATALRMSTEDLQAKMNESLKDVDFRVAIESVNANSKEAAAQIYAALPEQLQTMFKVALKDTPSFMASKEYADLIKSGQGELARQIIAVSSGLKSGNITNGQADDAMKRLIKSTSFAESTMRRLAMLDARGLIDSNVAAAAYGLKDLRDKMDGHYEGIQNTEATNLAKVEDVRNRALAVLDTFVSSIMRAGFESDEFAKLLDNANEMLKTIHNTAEDLGKQLGPELFKFVNNAMEYLNGLFSKDVAGNINVNYSKIIGDILTSSGAAIVVGVLAIMTTFKGVVISSLSSWLKGASGPMSSLGGTVKTIAGRLGAFAALAVSFTNGIGRLSQSISDGGDAIESALNFLSGAGEGIIDPVFKSLTWAANKLGIVSDEAADGFSKYISDTNLQQFLGLQDIPIKVETTNKPAYTPPGPTATKTSAYGKIETPKAPAIIPTAQPDVADAAKQSPTPVDPTSNIKPIENTGMSSQDMLNRSTDKLIRLQEEQIRQLQELVDIQRRALAATRETGFTRTR